MTKKYTVIGSGVAGANAALTLLKKGYMVNMIDVGIIEHPALQSPLTFDSCKAHLGKSAQSFFYGKSMNGVIHPYEDKLFKYPERRTSISKNLIDLYKQDISQFSPTVSYAMGGLASSWGANSIEYNNDDMIGFVYRKKEIEDSYREAYLRFGVAGPKDDSISRIVSKSANFKHTHKLDKSDKILLKTSEFYNENFKTSPDVLIGQSRLAINANPRSESSCYSCGLCIWGCPVGSIYDPKKTILECESYSGFTYSSGLKVSYFKVIEGKITSIVAEDSNSTNFEIKVKNIILAAGAINSALILLKSFRYNDIDKNDSYRTHGLMDTGVIKIPYMHIPSFFKKFSTNKIQFNGLISLIKGKSDYFPKYTQVELLSLGSLIYHPLVGKIPIGVKNGLSIFNMIKPIIGVATIFLPDSYSKNNYIELRFDGGLPLVKYHYKQSQELKKHKKDIVQKLTRHLTKLGCIILPFQANEEPSGSGIHYAGTIPIKGEYEHGCVNSDCQSYDFKNLHVVDGSVFPSLPSKSITLNIAANSIRVCKKL